MPCQRVANPVLTAISTVSWGAVPSMSSSYLVIVILIVTYEHRPLSGAAECILQDRERKRQKLADEAADAYIGAGDLANGGGGATVVSPTDEEPVKPQARQCPGPPHQRLSKRWSVQQDAMLSELQALRWGSGTLKTDAPLDGRWLHAPRAPQALRVSP